MGEYVKSNLNLYIKFKPTPKGIAHMVYVDNADYKRLNMLKRVNFDYWNNQIKDGYLMLQMHTFIDYFGNRDIWQPDYLSMDVLIQKSEY